MRTTSRLALSAAVLGTGLALASPASAQQTCAYPFDCPIGGGDVVPTTDTTSGGSSTGGSGSGSLPFTGGEVTLMALGGLAALGGGGVLVAAGRKRATA